MSLKIFPGHVLSSWLPLGLNGNFYRLEPMRFLYRKYEKSVLRRAEATERSRKYFIQVNLDKFSFHCESRT